MKINITKIIFTLFEDLMTYYLMLYKLHINYLEFYYFFFKLCVWVYRRSLVCAWGQAHWTPLEVELKARTFETNAPTFLKGILDRCVAQSPQPMKFNSVSKTKYFKLTDKKMRYGNSSSCAIAKTSIWKMWSFTSNWRCGTWLTTVACVHFFRQHHPHVYRIYITALAEPTNASMLLERLLMRMPEGCETVIAPWAWGCMLCSRPHFTRPYHSELFTDTHLRGPG